MRQFFPDAWVSVPERLVAEMDNDAKDRHVLAAAVAGCAHMVITDNVRDFRMSRLVESGQVVIERPSEFLHTVLKDHPDLMTSALWHLAESRHGVATIAGVLDQLHRNESLRPFVALARAELL